MNQMSLMFFVVVYGVFIVWYGGKSRPLTEVKTEDLLAGIWQSQGHANEPDTPIFNELRELAKSDDGRSYYMVNLMKFKT